MVHPSMSIKFIVPVVVNICVILVGIKRTTVMIWPKLWPKRKNVSYFLLVFGWSINAETC